MIWPDAYSMIGVVSPASGLIGAEFDAGVNAVRQTGVGVRIFSHARKQDSYVSAPAAERVADWNAAWADPDIDAILCSRGGFGSAQLLPLIDWPGLLRRSLPVLGYSDITALHFAMDKFQTGIPVAAPMLRHFPGLDEYSAAALRAALTRTGRCVGTFETLNSGVAAGHPLAGNLTVAASLIGTPYFPDPSGRILVLEDVGEPLYRIDRALTQLEQAGVFSSCGGLVFGVFSESGATAAEIRELLYHFARRANKPAVCGFPFGHCGPFCAMNFSSMLELRQGEIALLFR